ncbi:MAG TPA: tetratricopeptide repeat protein [Longimicrobium sp.]
MPPALTHGDDVFEGLGVLDEIPGEQGLVLWQTLRDALLWGQAAPDARGALFAPGAERARLAALLAAGIPPEVEEPLKAVAHMVGSPDAAREENVALACRQVAAWADERAMLATALAFAQAAAIVTPADPAAAFAVGRLARRRAEHARAESWYRRTIALARQVGDWPTYARAFLGLGTLYMERGNYPAARRFHERALKVASRNTLHHLEGSAQHNLFSIAVETGKTSEAHERARAALEAYGPTDPHLPRLAQDVADLWNTLGRFDRALPVLERLVSIFQTPAERLAVVGGLARAAGGLGRRDRFQQAWDDVWDLHQGGAAEEMASGAFLDLAHGAASLGLWDRAERAAQTALDLATRRNQGKVRLTAEAVLDSARHHRLAESRTAAASAAEDAAAESLPGEFVRSLQVFEGVG